jgi:hypothetical protein
MMRYSGKLTDLDDKWPRAKNEAENRQKSVIKCTERRRGVSRGRKCVTKERSRWQKTVTSTDTR